MPTARAASGIATPSHSWRTRIARRSIGHLSQRILQERAVLVRREPILDAHRGIGRPIVAAEHLAPMRARRRSSEATRYANPKATAAPAVASYSPSFRYTCRTPRASDPPRRSPARRAGEGRPDVPELTFEESPEGGVVGSFVHLRGIGRRGAIRLSKVRDGAGADAGGDRGGGPNRGLGGEAQPVAAQVAEEIHRHRRGEACPERLRARDDRRRRGTRRCAACSTGRRRRSHGERRLSRSRTRAADRRAEHGTSAARAIHALTCARSEPRRSRGARTTLPARRRRAPTTPRRRRRSRATTRARARTSHASTQTARASPDETAGLRAARRP